MDKNRTTQSVKVTETVYLYSATSVLHNLRWKIPSLLTVSCSFSCKHTVKNDSDFNGKKL